MFLKTRDITAPGGATIFDFANILIFDINYANFDILLNEIMQRKFREICNCYRYFSNFHELCNYFLFFIFTPTWGIYFS